MTKANNMFVKHDKPKGGHWYSFNCHVCTYKKTKKSLLTNLDCAINNFISGNKRWVIDGIAMSLGKADIIYRPPV